MINQFFDHIESRIDEVDKHELFPGVGMLVLTLMAIGTLEYTRNKELKTQLTIEQTIECQVEVNQPH